MEIDYEFVDALLVAIIGFIGALLGGRYSMRSVKQETSRKVFEKAYSKIFLLIEDYFYAKDISDNKINSLGEEIYNILETAEGYYYPSLKHYALCMFSPDYKGDISEVWSNFCWTFDRQYEKVSRDIGLPIRSRYYRMNKDQYSSFPHFLKIYFVSSYAILDFVLIIIFIGLIFLIKQR